MSLGLLLYSFMALASKPSPKVVALSPALAEIVFSLKQEHALVGVSDYTDHPHEARALPSVGPYNKPVLEKILSLHPSVVLLPKEGPEDIRFQLDRAKLKYEVISIKKISEVGSAARKIGDILGQPQAGHEFESKWDAEVKQILKNAPKSQTRTLIEIQKDPLIVAGGTTFLDEMIESCGGRNIFADFKGYPRISLELAFMRRPELILIASNSRAESQNSMNRWGQVMKSQSPRIVLVDPDLFTRPGPRLLQGLKTVCRILAEQR